MIVFIIYTFQAEKKLNPIIVLLLILSQKVKMAPRTIKNKPCRLNVQITELSASQ